LHALAVSYLLASVILSITQAQQSPQKPAEKPSSKASTPAEPENPRKSSSSIPANRFEANGDSRKEVHTRVKINSELGVRQFARLNFDYNRAFESIDLPLVRITHPSGGTVDILRQRDYRQSQSRRRQRSRLSRRPRQIRPASSASLPATCSSTGIITTVSNHPLAPDFWLSHDFAREGIVSKESFEIDLPASRDLKPFTSLAAHDYEAVRSGEGTEVRLIYRWKRPPTAPAAPENSRKIFDLPMASVESDIVLTTFKGWAEFEIALQKSYEKALAGYASAQSQGIELTHAKRKTGR